MTTHEAPGAYRPSRERWGSFSRQARDLPEGSVVVVDRRVARLHPDTLPILRSRKPRAVLGLLGGEGAKTFTSLQRVLTAGLDLPRSGTLVAVGGGTIGDVCTVAAHVLKRGVRLVQVPTTVLAAVDSSLGGKGAVDVLARGHWVKNPVGVFHYADETWVCPDFFTTLTEAQLREGAAEAWKMAVCLDAGVFNRWRRRRPELPALVRAARALKERVCAEDPYEHSGLRRVLNFGHTFGHVFESLSHFRLTHGEAVGLGMGCALDVGRVMGITPEELASQVEETLVEPAQVLSRSRMAAVARKGSVRQVARLLAADKKASPSGGLRMVLLERLGAARVVDVPAEVWRRLWPQWARGARP